MRRQFKSREFKIKRRFKERLKTKVLIVVVFFIEKQQIFPLNRVPNRTQEFKLRQKSVANRFEPEQFRVKNALKPLAHPELAPLLRQV